MLPDGPPPAVLLEPGECHRLPGRNGGAGNCEEGGGLGGVQHHCGHHHAGGGGFGARP